MTTARHPCDAARATKSAILAVFSPRVFSTLTWASPIRQVPLTTPPALHRSRPKSSRPARAPRIQEVAQVVAEHVEGEDRHADEAARDEDHPRGHQEGVT